MKHILEYIKEELFIEPVAGATIDFEEEFAADDIPIGYRLIINGKDVDIVVWYADYGRWLEKRYDKQQNMPKHEACLLDLMSEEEKRQYNEFCKEHRGCEFTSTIGGKISVEVTGTGIGYCLTCKCNSCGEQKNITDINSW